MFRTFATLCICYESIDYRQILSATTGAPSIDELRNLVICGYVRWKDPSPSLPGSPTVAFN